ncbi:hypothetical protein BCR41DRAFT_357066, partial [Lobosporangium transversale]
MPMCLQKNAIFTMSSVPVRRSGLQQEVINLYRQCFRAVRLKPETSRPHFQTFIRMQFRKHSDVKQRDFSTIEYLLRMGKRQLDTYSSPSIKDITV